LLTLLSPKLLFAEPGAAGESAIDAATAFDLAQVIVDGRMLSNVRGVPAYPAKRRAREIEGRIKAFAADPKLNPDDLRVVETEQSSGIVGPGGSLWQVFDFDAQFEGIAVERALVAETLLVRVREAVKAYREDRKPRVLLLNAGYAVLLSGLAVLVFFGSRWGLRRFSAWVEDRIPEHLETVEAKSFNLLQADQIWNLFRRAVTLAGILLAAVLAFLFIDAVLGLFPWTRLLATRLFDFFIDPLRTIGTDILDYLPNLGYLLVIVIIFRYLITMLHALFGAINKKRITFSGFDPEWAWPT
jgi:hypothetical protein